jgi:hypothetical protein
MGTEVSTPFRLPRRVLTEDGRTRRVGFELEYAGVGLEKAATAIVSCFGGHIRRENRFILKVEATRLGDFEVELDIGLLKDRSYAPVLEKLGIDPSGGTVLSVEEFLLETASAVAPFEVITPPLPMNALAEVDRLREELRLLKARGTKESIVYAFGLHINPEVPSTRVETTLSLLRAFLLLEPWIRSESAIDISRRISPFIKEFSPQIPQACPGPGLHPRPRPVHRRLHGPQPLAQPLPGPAAAAQPPPPGQGPAPGRG